MVAGSETQASRGPETAAPAHPPSAADLAYLTGRLAIVLARVQAAVARRRATDPDPDDRFRGLYVSDAHVDRLLAEVAVTASPPPPEVAEALAALERAATAAELRGQTPPLRGLARGFDLDEYDVEILLIALAPDLDPKFEQLYGYLHDDVTRRRASTGLAIELCGGGVGRAMGPARARLAEAAPLPLNDLLLVEDEDRPFLTRSLRVPDRVTSHLLGDDRPDPLVARLLARPVEVRGGGEGVLDRAIERGVRLAYLRERTGSTAAGSVVDALAQRGERFVALDLTRATTDGDVVALARAARREARLVGGALLAGPLDALAGREEGFVSAVAGGPSSVFLYGSDTWDARWSVHVPLVLDAPSPTSDQRRAVWRGAIDGDAHDGMDPAAATAHFRLTPDQIVRAARSARQQAEAAGRPVTAADLRAGARAQNAAGLERLARRLEPQVTWDDLVLSPAVLGPLRELVARARRRDQVLGDWGMGRGSSKGRGITALFAGESGTGKTISAEVVAGELGLDLYVIDLATVVDKYVGETEKNLDRIFAEADRLNGVLLFDEADAIFGKRSEVKDAHDRYANVEVAYLLQRMELFDGLAILTTNLRANVDEAFTRRLDAVVDFPMPDDEDRRLLWDQHLRPDVPRGDDIDLDFLARAFKVSGGNIRNIALSAAFLAADAGGPVTMADLIRATEREYRKLGHLCLEAEFGPYFPLVAAPPSA